MVSGRQSSRFGVQVRHQMRIRHKRQFCEVCSVSIAEYEHFQGEACGFCKAKLIELVITGLHIYMAGIGFQLFFICVFLYFALHLRQKMVRNTRSGISKPLSIKQVVGGKENQAFLLLYVMYIAVFLIGVSSHCIFLFTQLVLNHSEVANEFCQPGTYRFPPRGICRWFKQRYSAPRSLPVLS